METKRIKGLYFGVEVFNVDGVTGGFLLSGLTAWYVAAVAAYEVRNGEDNYIFYGRLRKCLR